MNLAKTFIRIDSDYINKVSINKLKIEIFTRFQKLSPAMVKRQKKIGSLGKALEDGNYFDLFIRARDNYIFGWFSSALILSRITAEQFCVKLLEDSGNSVFKWENEATQKQKLLEPLINTCKSKGLLDGTQSNNLVRVKKWSEEIIHAKGQLEAEVSYETNAFASLKFLGQIILQKFDYVAKIGRTSGYKYVGQTRRL